MCREPAKQGSHVKRGCSLRGEASAAMQHQAGMHLCQWHGALPSSSAGACSAGSTARVALCAAGFGGLQTKNTGSPGSMSVKGGSRGPL